MNGIIWYIAGSLFFTLNYMIFKFVRVAVAVAFVPSLILFQSSKFSICRELLLVNAQFLAQVDYIWWLAFKALFNQNFGGFSHQPLSVSLSFHSAHCLGKICIGNISVSWQSFAVGTAWPCRMRWAIFFFFFWLHYLRSN